MFPKGRKWLDLCFYEHVSKTQMFSSSEITVFSPLSTKLFSNVYEVLYFFLGIVHCGDNNENISFEDTFWHWMLWDPFRIYPSPVTRRICIIELKNLDLEKSDASHYWAMNVYLLSSAVIGADGYCRRSLRSTVRPSVRPERLYCSNSLWLSAISTTLGASSHQIPGWYLKPWKS